MPEYYTEDTERIPFRAQVTLFQQHLPKWLATPIVAWIRLRRRLGFPAPPLHATLWESDFEWQAKQVMPAQAQSCWAPLIEQLEDRRFTICGFHASKTLGNKEAATCFLIDEPETTMASLLWLRIGGPEGIQQITISFTSWGRDGVELVTSGLPKIQHMLADPLKPDYIRLICTSDKKPITSIYNEHCARPEMSGAVRFSVEELLARYKSSRTRFFEHSRKIGTLRKLSEKEVETLKRQGG